MLRWFDKLFQAFWPLGLFAFFFLIAMSFEGVRTDVLAYLFGMVVVACAALGWLINDIARPGENHIRTRMAEMSDLLKPYDGLKLREMPYEVQVEVHRRLGWDAPKPPKAAKAPAKK